MLPNVEIEYLLGRVMMNYVELRCREQKKCSLRTKYMVLLVPLIADTLVYWCMVHTELFSISTIKAIKSLGVLVIFFSKRFLYTSGIWGTLVVATITDFLLGIAIMSRYLIMWLLGIPMGNYTSQMRIVPLLILTATAVAVGTISGKLLKRFQEALAFPGILLKFMSVCYWLPCFLFLRPGDVLDLAHEQTMLISGVTVMIVLYLGGAFLVSYQRRISEENHYLTMQTEIFCEHGQMLKEQTRLIKGCEKYLSFDMNIRGNGEYHVPNTENSEPIYSENAILDVVIRNKLQQCWEQEIAITLPPEGIELPSDMPEVQFLLIFYNLFDNAMESARQCEKEERYITIGSAEDADEYHFWMENSWRMGHSLNRRLITTKEDKENHGFGLKIVRDILADNHGELKIIQEKERFIAEVLIRH